MLWGIDFASWWQIVWVKALVITVGATVTGFLFDRVVARLLVLFTAKTRTDIDDQIVAVLHRPIFWSVTLGGAWWAIRVLALPKPAPFILVGVIKTVAVILWTRAFLSIGSIFLSWLSRAREKVTIVQPQTLPLFEIVVKVLAVGGGLYALLLAWDINVTGWLASAGILGIAIGFAAKDTLANLFAGVFILADAPYKIGDYVVLGDGERGKVTDIGMRSTRILTRDDIEIVVPNSAIANGKIINESGGPRIKRRLRVAVGVAYGSDVDQVRQILMTVAQEDPEITDDPYPRVRFRAFGDSSLDFELLCWVDEPEWTGRIHDKLNTKVYKAFNEEGVQIPFPQRDVHFFRGDVPAAGDAAPPETPAAPVDDAAGDKDPETRRKSE